MHEQLLSVVPHTVDSFGVHRGSRARVVLSFWRSLSSLSGLGAV